MADELSRDRFPNGEGAPRNPVTAAQEAMRQPRSKRFYAQAGVEERDGAFVLTLDGRVARTPGRNRIAVPTRALAEALAKEWDAQGTELDPAAMPLTRLVNSAIDGVRAATGGVIEDIVKFARSDLVCYRAGEPARLVGEQALSWDPVLGWAREELGASFLLSEGVTFVTQPEPALAKVRARVEAMTSPFDLAALHVMTALTGSALIALAHVGGRLTAADAWAAAHVDERFQESVWGEDQEAMQRRARREAEFMAASRLYALSR
jgi:chaperone required for assembly of F1-ATPase